MRAGLFDQAGVAGPAARAAAVETGDNGNIHRLPSRLDVFQIAVRTRVVRIQFREIIQSLRDGICMELLQIVNRGFLVFDLFLKQRRQHGRGGSGIFQSAQGIHVGGQR